MTPAVSRPICPDCDSKRISADGDAAEPLAHPDRLPADAVYYQWWHCEDCGHDWRYQDEDLNP